MALLERSPALDQLDSWWAEVRAGCGRFVLIEGEAGVGKTALLDAFTERVRAGDFRLLSSGCDAYLTPRPLGPLVDIAPDLAGSVPARLPAAALDGASPQTAGVVLEGDRDGLFAAVLAQLDDGKGPRVLVIEDLHWADDATLDLLRFLARRIGRRPVLIIGSYRDDQADQANPIRLMLGDLAAVATLRRLPLVPLSLKAVTAMVHGHGIDPRRLHAITGGNPFYVTEVMATAGQEVPPTVRDAVFARAARLSAPAREVLDAAAVVAAPVETWLLAEVAGVAAERLDECVAAGILRERQGGLQFRHELARLAIERAMPPGRRGDLHRRALAALLARSGLTHDPTRLAYHAEGAADAAQVLAYAIPAGDWAASLGAHRAAADQYARALRFSAGLTGADLADLSGRHSYECYLIGRYDEAVASRERALNCWRSVGHRLRQGDSLRWLSRLAWLRGYQGQAQRLGRVAVSTLQLLPPGPELAMAYSNLAQLGMLAGDWDIAQRWGQQAIDLAERLGLNDVLAHALNNLGTAQSSVDPVAGRTKLTRSLALAMAHDLEEHVARAYNNLAFSSVTQRQLSEANRWLAEGLEYCADRDLDSWRLALLASQATVLLHQGSWDAALEIAEDLRRDPRAASFIRLETLVVIGRIRARRGDPGVWPALREAIELPNATGELPRWLWLAVACAEAAWLGGEPARARALVEQALEAVASHQDGANGWAAAELYGWARRLDLPTPQLTDVPEPYAQQAAGDWAGAAASWRALDHPYEAAWALAGSAREADLRAAVAQLRELGAAAAAAVVSRRLREMGIRGVARGAQAGTRANPANLTDRQSQVLALMADGLRNADIAARLFISSKTVDHHVSAILSKLGARTRGEAVRAAAGR
jgi:DNA-binding CsgD family transcriptional regulator/tetratricopeptide (TPR) repeat protein